MGTDKVASITTGSMIYVAGSSDVQAPRAEKSDMPPAFHNPCLVIPHPASPSISPSPPCPSPPLPPSAMCPANPHSPSPPFKPSPRRESP